jgi:hypothetical protein
LLSLLLVVFVCSFAVPAFAAACANEQFRRESFVNPVTQQPYSTQLPDCRAYELVSPDNNEGPVESTDLFLWFSPEGRPSTQSAWYGVLPFGNLYGQLRSALDVQGLGPSVSWNSEATPPGTGAIADGRQIDAFRTVRSPTGWVTRDILPYAYPFPGGGTEEKALAGVSADGSSALVDSNAVLTPSAFENPTEWYPYYEGQFFLYRVAGSSTPELVSRGEDPIPGTLKAGGFRHNRGFLALSASPTFATVAFASGVKLEEDDVCNTDEESYLPGVASLHTTVYLWNANAKEGHEPWAHTIVSLPTCTTPNVDGVPTILADGRPIIEPNPANPLGVKQKVGPKENGYTYGPLVLNDREVEVHPNALTPLAGPDEEEGKDNGGQLLATSPDGSTAYVASRESLDANHPVTKGANEIYAVSTSASTGGIKQEGGRYVGGTCISCETDQTAVTYVGLSKDGSHLFFTTGGAEPGLWSSDAQQGGKVTRLTEDIELSQIIISENGQFVAVVTSQALLAGDTNSAPDIYEFGTGQEPRLVTSGKSTDTYTLTHGGVSNDGSRVVYDDQPHEALETIDEWVAGETRQISPLDSEEGYSVQAVAGGELENVFFLANELLVPADGNTLNTTIYDARVEGGFEPCTPGDPIPPSGIASCLPGATQGPVAPQSSTYAPALAPPGIQPAPLPVDTAQPPAKPRSLTRAQRLAKALKACRKTSRRKRAGCESRARKQYTAKTTKKSGRKS